MSVYTNPPGGPGGGMNRMNDTQPWHRWQDWVNLVLGVWLFVAPWIWHSTTPSSATWTNSGPNAWILGGLIFLMSLWALAMPAVKFPEWINALAGLWLFIAPWALGFARVTASSAWNQWAVGVIVFVLAVWAASTAGGTHARTGGMHTA